MIHSTERNRRCSKMKLSQMLIAKSEAIALNHRKPETIRRLRMKEKTTLTPTTATVMDTTAPAAPAVPVVVQLAPVLQEHQRSAQFHSSFRRLYQAFQALARATKAVEARLVKLRMAIQPSLLTPQSISLVVVLTLRATSSPTASRELSG